MPGAFFAVDDPIYGKSDVTYAVLQSSYQGTGSWTEAVRDLPPILSVDAS